MAHMIDNTTGKDAIAYVGETPWHGLGQQLTAGASIEQWRTQAGLDWQVNGSPVRFTANGNDSIMPDRQVLYRSDTNAALSVVSTDYRIVQPSAVLDFFAELSEVGGFELEVMGALSGGKRIWGLAKVGDGANVIGQDEVRPYVLLATGYDGLMATNAKFTAIRVVCHNTITMALGSGKDRVGKSEQDTENKAVSSLVRIPHSAKFDPTSVRMSLGIVRNAWEKWLVQSRILAEQSMNEAQADAFLKALFPAPAQTPGTNHRPIEQSKGYTTIMDLFYGGAIGSDLTQGQSKWAMLNAVTEYVDHRKGRESDSRLNSAWFGEGDNIKNRAMALLAA